MPPPRTSLPHARRRHLQHAAPRTTTPHAQRCRLQHAARRPDTPQRPALVTRGRGFHGHRGVAGWPGGRGGRTGASFILYLLIYLTTPLKEDEDRGEGAGGKVAEGACERRDRAQGRHSAGPVPPADVETEITEEAEEARREAAPLPGRGRGRAKGLRGWGPGESPAWAKVVSVWRQRREAGR